MTVRQPTPVDAIADSYTRRLAELDPLEATGMGIPGHDHQMTDHSPSGYAERADLDRATLAALAAAAPLDEVDRVTIAAMTDRLGLALELDEAGESLASLNVIASPVQGLRDILDIMPTATTDDWANIAARVSQVPWAVQGYIESLRTAAARGLVAAQLQVSECIKQASELADPSSSFFVTFLASATPDGTPASGPLANDLAMAGRKAAAAYGELVTFLEDELGPQAPADDAVGRDRYALWSRAFVGASIDLDETYEWGLDELARMAAEQDAVVAEIAGPGASIHDAVAKLEADPSRALHGKAALQEWMQATADEATRALDGVHFDIPEAMRRIECMIAPTETGGIYYTGPSDDFSRPGRMWWSVPPGVTEFSTWREKTTVYHEGVPGHHLQIAQAVLNRDELNLWRRLASWSSGHGEGWALYAERLMEEFGFMDDLGDRLGLVDGQRMRATRVVLDIGVHLRKPAPAQWGGGTWDAAKAWDCFKANVNMDEAFLRFELNRYLGWPGQAPSYKVGQRLWETYRAQSKAAAEASGREFSLKDFHTRALNLGSVPLSVLPLALGLRD
ncbi:MAG: DUF885 domain-containing protein [Propionicimonas sp.]|uniref:DUF885 domain-containing protein n=1 Tax=Propionicimonas sp. TaxID=1955623 RepID=UPI003D141BC7